MRTNFMLIEFVIVKGSSDQAERGPPMIVDTRIAVLITNARMFMTVNTANEFR
jgi:hypothetical protein